MVQLVGDEVPAPIDFPDPHSVKDPHLVVEGGCGVGLAERLKGLDGEARVGGVDQEHGDSLMGREVWIGTRGQPDEVGVVGETGVQLLPTDDPVLAVTHCPGAE